MVLMYGQHGSRRIHNVRLERARLPEQPVVPPESSDSERRDVRIKTTGKSKIVDTAGDLQLTAPPRVAGKVPGPVVGKNDRIFDVEISPAADHQESVTPLSDTRDSLGEVVEQNDVRVDVA